jgi:hypothetical protein
MRVEVFVFGVRVSDETGIVWCPEGEPIPEPRALGLTQDVWVYGLPLLAGTATGLAAIGITLSLIRLTEESRDTPRAGQDAKQGSPNE